MKTAFFIALFFCSWAEAELCETYLGWFLKIFPTAEILPFDDNSLEIRSPEIMGSITAWVQLRELKNGGNLLYVSEWKISPNMEKRQGIGTMLIAAFLMKLKDPIHRIGFKLADDNKLAYEKAVQEGKSPDDEAIRETPAYKASAKLGFTHFVYFDEPSLIVGFARQGH
jgi:hypothetical protein